MNKLTSFGIALVATGCAHVQPEPVPPPLDNEAKAYVESRLAEPVASDPEEVDAEITATAREVALCVFRDGETRKDVNNYKARLTVHVLDRENIVAEAVVGSEGKIALGLDRVIYDYYGENAPSRTQMVDDDIDGKVDWYKFRALRFGRPGTKHVEFNRSASRTTFYEWDAQQAYEKALRMIVARCEAMRGGK